jgi:hypothetical protein
MVPSLPGDRVDRVEAVPGDGCLAPDSFGVSLMGLRRRDQALLARYQCVIV